MPPTRRPEHASSIATQARSRRHPVPRPSADRGRGRRAARRNGDGRHARPLPESRPRWLPRATPDITSFALDLLPRISRAQSMDVLSSQALLAGYRLVTLAADAFGRMFGMTMTAAGTLAPARVLVLGAGVAGLQAIATAKRLGGVVSANDVRAASADEVRSVGGTFIDLDLGDGRGRRRIREGARRRPCAPAAGAARTAHRGIRHRHHDRRGARPRRAAARHGGHGRGDEARIGARRPRRRVGRQHRGVGSGRAARRSR